MQALVDDLNGNGGIGGRQLEVVYKSSSPLGTEAAEAACLELTADEEVFAVIGGFVGPAEPANTCIVGTQDTILVGGVQSAERLEVATAPWIAEVADRTRSVEILLSLLDGEGLGAPFRRRGRSRARHRRCRDLASVQPDLRS